MDVTEVRSGGVNNGNGHTHNEFAGDTGLAADERRRREREDDDDKRLAEMLYTVQETPAWYLCLLLGLQHCMTCFGANLSVALIIAPAMCIYDNVVISQVLGTIFFIGGLVTLLQSTLGTRLPLVQGATFAYIVPTFSILNLPQWKCPALTNPGVEGDANLTLWNNSLAHGVFNESNSTDPSGESMDPHTLWKSRMREIQGAIMLASLFEVLMGFTGLIGILVRYIGPLAIGPTITLVGLALFPAAANFAAKNWYIAILTAFLIILFSQYMRNLNVPLCRLNENRKCVRTGYPIFTLFPVILGILLAWALCAILTVTNAIPNDKAHWSYEARTDVKIKVLHEAAWFRFPYPFQWGIPTFSVGAVFGMLAGVIAGTVESIGDFYPCARLAGAPPPPVHAVNRGIFMEGLGCVLAGMWGSGSGSTTYSENIGTIGITKVGSRRVVQFGAVFLMLFGILGKFGAMFVTIPDPIIGGVFLVMFGIISSVGVSNLQFVDLNSSRNLCIFGFSVFFGLAFPKWLTTGDNVKVINTGNTVADQILSILLSTSMFVGGAIGFILDNTIPGTEKERGLIEWRANLKGSAASLNAAAATKQQTSTAAMASMEPSLDDTVSDMYPPAIIPASRIHTDTTTDSSRAAAVTSGDVNLAEASNHHAAAAADAGAAAGGGGASAAAGRFGGIRAKDRSRHKTLECYELPYISKHLRRWNFFRFVPISPSFLEPALKKAEEANASNRNVSMHTDRDIESDTERDREIIGGISKNGKWNSAIIDSKTGIEGVSFELKHSADL